MSSCTAFVGRGAHLLLAARLQGLPEGQTQVPLAAWAKVIQDLAIS